VPLELEIIFFLWHSWWAFFSASRQLWSRKWTFLCPYGLWGRTEVAWI